MNLATIAVVALLFSPGPYVRADTLVFAASSLADVLEEIITVYEQQAGKNVSASYAASSILARQIEAGAPAHVFISADENWMNYLNRRGFLSGAPRILAGNRLVLIAPADHTASIAIGRGMDLAGILGRERMAIADPAGVPAGRVAREALEYYGEWQALQGRFIPLDNVRAALIAVEKKEAPLGIVYETDALASPGIRVVGVFPAQSHKPVVYPAALIAANRDADAEALFAYLQTPPTKAVFTRHGFRDSDGAAR